MIAFELIISQILHNEPIVVRHISMIVYFPIVYAPQVDGGFCITEHLIQQGYKNIALLGGPKHLDITQKREAGYKKALKKNRVAVNKSLIAYCDFSQENTVSALQNRLKLKTKPDVIFSIFHKGAIDAMLYLKEKKSTFRSRLA